MASARDESGFGWTDPAWRGEVDAWIRGRCTVTGRIEQPHVRPWGTALRVLTSDGVVWFKACIPTLGFEGPLLELLNAAGLGAIPTIVASDAERGWMLLEDAGRQLYELEGYELSAERWADVIGSYARLQVEAVPFADALVDAGVPDCRSPRLVGELAALLEDERNLRASPDDAVTREEAARLRAALPVLREHAERLDALGLPFSIQHDDVHMWNVFVRGAAYVFLDWGDSCVSHPLLSLGVPFEHSRAEIHDRIRDAYLERWTAYAPRHELVPAAESALVLAKITAILKWARIHRGLDAVGRAGYDEVVSHRARDLLESACA